MAQHPFDIPRQATHARSRATGFTLMEVLVAMSIFLVGIIAVAAIFPTAIIVQRDTVESLMGQQVSRLAEQEMQAIALSGVVKDDALTYHHDPTLTDRRGTLLIYTDPSINDTVALGPNGRNLRAMPLVDYSPQCMNQLAQAVDTDGNALSGLLPDAPETLPGFDGFQEVLSREARSYPKTPPIYTSRPGVDGVNLRDYYWFPFIQVSADGPLDDINTLSVVWQGFAIVMHRQPNMENVPQIRYTDLDQTLSAKDRIDWTRELDNDYDNDGLPDLIKPGDFVLADNGVLHRVILADKNGCRVRSGTLQNAGLNPYRIYFVVNVDANGRVKREAPSPVAWVHGPFNIPVQDPGPS